ncbi:hypothetical protein K402DRAFT_170744 [Aulographum hederae CBS 113979]|uniref:Nonsense-mediated mRNA decay factor n=1 Tax=Aulographum hederae CBS 113979 TaxID=1176131 RepID=A0A6G1HCX0_9PEZI|nr:hypothetical protein K402DRAFT_170744 [Aulographum hederae CBS 113979]
MAETGNIPMVQVSGEMVGWRSGQPQSGYVCIWCKNRLFQQAEQLSAHIQENHDQELGSLVQEEDCPSIIMLMERFKYDKRSSDRNTVQTPPVPSSQPSEPSPPARKSPEFPRGNSGGDPRRSPTHPGEPPPRRKRPREQGGQSSQRSRSNSGSPRSRPDGRPTQLSHVLSPGKGSPHAKPQVHSASNPRYEMLTSSPMGNSASSSRPPSQPQPPLLRPYQPGITDPRWPNLVLQQDSRDISQEQLAAEVKSIYAGLVMVESKCIHVDKAQSETIHADSDSDSEMADDHWQALIALHKTLLHEHHDFFLASQHPCASPVLKRLAAKYSMPARMWKHGIHSFLELLRHRLPESLEYMLTFIYLAYHMMALLLETVPSFEDTWIECLGDLGRYRMAVEDEDLRDRDIWAGVARLWYSKAADRNPMVGRLYHHLAILARPHAIQQIYYYSRALTCCYSFSAARDSIMILFDPFLGYSQMSSSHMEIDANFIRLHAILFEQKSLAKVTDIRPVFDRDLDGHISRMGVKWKEQGAYLAVTNAAAVCGYGLQDHPLRRLMDFQAKRKTAQQPGSESAVSEESLVSLLSLPTQPPELESSFFMACDLTFSTLSIACRRSRLQQDNNTHPHIHIILSLLLSFASVDDDLTGSPSYDNTAIRQYVVRLLDSVPWTDVISILNTLRNLVAVNAMAQIVTVQAPFTPQAQGGSGPLPEDYFIRGQFWSQWYFPETWFSEQKSDEERSIEHASTIKARIDRILYLGECLAKFGRWMQYDAESGWSKVQAPEEPVPMDVDEPGNSDTDSGYGEGYDSPEMNQFTREGRLGTQSVADNVASTASTASAPQGAASMLKPGYTVSLSSNTMDASH